jgi:hypothetical protein
MRNLRRHGISGSPHCRAARRGGQDCAYRGAPSAARHIHRFKRAHGTSSDGHTRRGGRRSGPEECRWRGQCWVAGHATRIELSRPVWRRAVSPMPLFMSSEPRSWPGNAHASACPDRCTSPGSARIHPRAPHTSRRAAEGRFIPNRFPEATVLRPSVMFGFDDAFLNTLAGLARRTPLFLLIGGGRTRLQPVHVADVAEAVVRVLREPSSQGRTYELGGPRIYTLRESVDAILRALQVCRAKAPIPFWMARNIARLLQRLPGSPLTITQVELLSNRQHRQAGRAGTGGSRNRTTLA